MIIKHQSSLLSSSAAALVVVLAAGLLLLEPAPSAAATSSLRGSSTFSSSISSSSSTLSSSFGIFPPHAQCDRASTQSPLRLFLDPTASGLEPVGNQQRYCFRVTSRSRCDAGSKCCDPAQLSVSKIELDIVAGCKDSLRRVTVNGQGALYEFDTQLSVLRVNDLVAATTAVPSGSADALPSAANAQICVFLDGASVCPSLAKFCTRRAGGSASPGGACRYAIFHANQECCPVSIVPAVLPSLLGSAMSAVSSSQNQIQQVQLEHEPVDTSASATTATATVPSYRSDFPYYQCQRNPAGSRLFATADPNVTVVANELTRICFDVGLHQTCANPTSQCCDFTLYKLELEVDLTCADALAYTTIDGVQHVRYLQTAPHAAIKIVNLNKEVSAIEGTRVCLFLRPQCNSLAKLCAFHDGTCTVGMFSKPGNGIANCCPLSTVSI